MRVPLGVDGETWGHVIQHYVDKSVVTPVAYAYRGDVVTGPNLKPIVTTDILYVPTDTMKRS